MAVWAAVVSEMARELLAVKVSNSSATLTQNRDMASRSRRTRWSSSSSSRSHLVVDATSDDEFRTYRKFSQDAGRTERDDDGIVMSLIRRCRSQSSSRCSRRRRRTDDDDDDDDGEGEEIELCQLSGVALMRLSELSDAGHKFTTVYVDVPVWCDQCGQLIILVYGHYAVCQCECRAHFEHV